MQKTPQKYRLGLAGVVAVSCVSALAGSATYDFTTDPKEDSQFIITSNLDAAPWVHPDTQEELGTWEGKNGNPGGYFAITRSVGSQATQMLFPDFDNGLIVKAFNFECDLRLGNPTGNAGRPADGFSISYARANDPAVQNLINNPTSTDTGQYAVAGGSENGTKTGIAISFDTWSGNTLPDGADVEGIIVRVDNVTVSRTALPTRNGSATDVTSLQTGPYDAEADAAGSGGKYEGLSWVKLGVVLADNGELTVTYKGATLVDKFQTGYAPSAGRLIVAGRTGGANENNHLDNVKITTFAADKALFAGGTATAAGYTLTLSDSGQSIVNESTVTVKIDDVAVTPTSVTKTGDSTVIKIDTTPNWLVSGSVHVADVRFSDTQNNALGGVRNVTVAAYTTLTPAMEVTGVNKSQRGFLLRTWYLANEDGTPLAVEQPNTTARAEQELFGELGANMADNLAELNQTIPGTANKYIVEAEYLNHDQQQTPQGMFTENAVDAQRQAPEKQIPGINPADLSNMACEALFFAEFPAAGLYTFGCNSDDGFAMYAGRNPLDRFQVDGVKIGEYSGGRGTDANNPSTLFGFLVEKAGVYPLRFIWEEGGGGSNFEVYQQLADGTVALINDTERAPSVVKAYWDGPRTARAYISKISPGVGIANLAYHTPLEITLTDDGTTVVDGSVKLLVNGTAVTPTVTKSGKNTVVRYNPMFWPTGANTINVQYSESGGGSRDQAFAFSIFPAAADLPANSFVIEAEHFDNNGQAVAGITGSGYTGNEYRGLAAVHDVDYHQDGNTPDQDGAYRATFAAGLNPHVPMDSQLDASPNLDTARPGFDVTTNFKIGWAGNGEWYNYTRTIPAGNYTAYAAQSIDPAGTAGGDVGLVTAGAGTANQTVKLLASVRGTPPGGWGNNGLLPALDASGTSQAFALPGGKVTLRYTTQGGDFDWFALVPTTVQPPPDSPTLSITPAGVITYTGTLESSPTVNTGYAPVGGATSPYTVPKTGAAMYYRSKN